MASSGLCRCCILIVLIPLLYLTAFFCVAVEVMALTGTSEPIVTAWGAQTNPRIDGTRVVYTDDRNAQTDIYMYDIATESERQICGNPYSQGTADICGDIIVWRDFRNGDHTLTTTDIYMFNLSTNAESPICTASGAQESAITDGRFVVWQDDRNSNDDVYGYDLQSETEFSVTTAAGTQTPVAIDNGILVYFDQNPVNRLCTYNLTSKVGSELIVTTLGNTDGDLDGEDYVCNGLGSAGLTIVNITTKSVTILSNDLIGSPRISGDLIVYDVYDYDTSNWDVHCYDRRDDSITPIATGTPAQRMPDVSGIHIIWKDTSEDENGDIYHYQVDVPELSVAPSLIDFGVVEEGYSGDVSFQVWNSGTGILTYDISEPSTWIVSVSPDCGDCTTEVDTIEVMVDATGLVRGMTYAANLSIDSSGGSGRIPVSITIGDPALSFSPGLLDFGAVSQGYVGSDTFEIWNSGTGKLDYSFAFDSDWISSVTPLTGNSSGETDFVSVTIDTSDLLPGTSADTIITITSNGGGGSVVVSVGIPIVPVLAYSPESLSFGNVTCGFSGSKTFEIWNSGTGTLCYTISTESSWITSVAPVEGNSSGEPDVITISIDTANLPSGSTYTNLTSISSNGGNGAVSVTVSVENSRPVAFIDEIDPNPAEQGQIVSFYGHGYDEDGIITSYRWRSGIDGVLSSSEDFQSPTLSIGSHTIYYMVMDDDGDWSEEVSQNLVVGQNNPPELTWVGTTGYIQDGVSPDSGDTRTSFCFRVKYKDVDNNPALSGYPVVHIVKGGIELSDGPFLMDYVSGSVSSGVIYEYSCVLSSAGSDYSYCFEAYDSVGESAVGDAIIEIEGPIVAQGLPLASPSAPLMFTAAAEPGQITLNWSSPDDDGGSPVLHFRIYRSTDSTHPVLMTTVGNDTFSHIDSSVASSRTYFYWVSALNSVGEGNMSAYASATTPAHDPTASIGNQELFVMEVAAAIVGGGALTAIAWFVSRRRRQGEQIEPNEPEEPSIWPDSSSIVEDEEGITADTNSSPQEHIPPPPDTE